MKYFVGLFFSIFSLLSVSAAPIQEIRYFQTDARYDYRIKLLQLILNKTQVEFGPALLHPTTQKMTHGRGEYSLEHGKIDVAFFATNKLREQKFQAIKYPILQGILGYRVLLVNKKNQRAFANIKKLSQLTTDFIGGFGTHWADMSILRDNHLKITGNPLYLNLFAMLNANRFDYFPRGINEIWQESARLGSDYANVTVENSLALYYPYPVYFFVTKGNQRLAQRIKQGLKQALNDGSLKALFLDYHLEDIKRSQLDQRNILVLENRQLPDGTPKIDCQWWLALARKPDSGNRNKTITYTMTNNKTDS